jgi:hypothetical protein
MEIVLIYSYQFKYDELSKGKTDLVAVAIIGLQKLLNVMKF